MRHYYVNDISLASILDAFGIPKRQPDPVTKEIRLRDGKDVVSGKWWYDLSNQEDADKCKELCDAYYAARNWESFMLDKEHPLYWMKGALENRTANLHLFHHGAAGMRVIESGDMTIYMGERISEKDKQTLKAQL